MLAGPGRQLHNGLVGRVAVQAHLRLQGVLVGREGAALHQHLVARGRGAVEGHQQQVQVGGEVVHHDNLVGQGPYYRRLVGRHGLVVAHPGRVAGEVAVHGLLGPGGQFLIHGGAHGLGLQAQRVAAEVKAVAAAGRRRNQEAGAEGMQRVLGVEVGGEGGGGVEGHLGKSTHLTAK